MWRSHLGRASDKSHHLPHSIHGTRTPAGPSTPARNRCVPNPTDQSPSNTQGDDSCAFGTQPLRGWATPITGVPVLGRASIATGLCLPEWTLYNR